MRRIFTLLAVLALTSSAFALSFSKDGLRYTTFGTDSVLVNGLDDWQYSGAVVIPNNVYYDGKAYKVAELGRRAFKKTNISSLEVKAQLDEIPYEAFYQCTSLATVTISGAVKTIDYYAFQDCTSLTKVSIANGLETIGNFAFYGCTSLTTFNIPETIRMVDTDAFANTAWWNSQPDGLVYKDKVLFGYKGSRPEGHLAIAPGTRVVCPEAFRGSYNLTSVHFPSSVVGIGQWLFGGCNNLKSITIDSANPVYDSRYGCNAIIETATNTLLEGCQTTVIPDGIVAIGPKAFRWCWTLERLTIPSSVTKIGGSAFLQTGLDSLFIPRSVTSIQSQAFEYNYNLKSLVVEEGNPVYDSRQGCNAIIETARDSLIVGCKATVIPDGIVAIGPRAFHGISLYDTPLVIPSSVRYIGGSLFWEGYASEIRMLGEEPFRVYSLLEDWNIGECTLYVPMGCKERYEQTEGWSKNFPTIKEMAMDDDYFFDLQPDGTLAVSVNPATKKTTFDIPATKAWGSQERTVATVSSRAFYNRATMTAVTIPASVDSIGSQAFYGCNALRRIAVDPANKTLDSREQCNAIVVTASDSLIVGCPATVFTSTIRHIGDRAFYGCVGLAKAELFSSVQTIGSEAFYGCTNLATLGLSYGIRSIGNSAFSGCEALGEVVLPATVETIGNYAFQGCSRLKSLTIPIATTTIGTDVVRGCTSLSQLDVAEGNAVYDSRYGCNAIVETATDRLIAGCATTEVPATVRHIGPNALRGCQGLGSIALPPSVESIGSYAFSASGLKTIALAEGLDSIAHDAFTNCDGIEAVVIPSTTTFIGNYAFESCDSLMEVVSLVADTATCRVMKWVFSGLDLKERVLKVPAGSEGMYRRATVWKEFGTIVGIDPSLYAPAVVRAQSREREYGEANPAWEYTVEGGTLGGTPTIECEATAASGVGTYAITLQRGTVQNVNVAYLNGQLTVTKAPLTISVASAEREQGQANAPFELTFEGWKLDDDESVLAQQPVVTCVDADGKAVDDSTPAGDYVIAIGAAEADNYAIVYRNGILTIKEPSGIAHVAAATQPADIFTTSGVLVRSQATTTAGLPAGVYIVGGRKVVVK